MNLQEIIKQIEIDVILDETKLDSESLKIPQLHAKWIINLINEEKTLKTLLLKKDKEYLNKTEWYSGKKSDKEYREKQYNHTVLKKDIDFYINADEEYQDLRGKIEIQQLKVDLIKEFIKAINNRGFLIKNAIDFKKFNNGGY